MKDEPPSDATSMAAGATLPLDQGGAPPGEPRRDATPGPEHLVAIDPGHYLLGREIARGGMGRIVAAHDLRLGRPVAIKELLHDDRDARARFEREARITARLQHPAIVNIHEAGRWPSGAPFYAMKLVSGRSLEQVIAERTTVAARLALLPTIIAAVDALAYAHAARVIHRDLKPMNILVGEFGETVVIDWGLAKDLAGTGDDPDLPAGPRRASAGTSDTAAGAVMGTPAYMPVEQAHGEAVDERADVYALGAMLYHVLAGVPPYAGKTAEATLVAVVEGPPPPLAGRAAAIPPDLVTIVEKAMARSPADRYPTAQELADDLKRFQTGQLVGAHQYSPWQLVRRWYRRHRAPVLIAGVATAVLATVGIVSVTRVIRERDRANQQRSIAMTGRAAAEELADFMLGDLRDRLAPVGRLDVLDGIGGEVERYYRTIAAADPAADRRHATSLAIVADVKMAKGDLEGALASARLAFDRRQRAAATRPWDEGARADVAASHDQLGDIDRARGDLDGARGAYQAARDLRAALVERAPTDRNRTLPLARSHDRLGDVALARGDLGAARLAYVAGRDLRDRAVERDARDEEARRELSVSHDKLGDVEVRSGDLRAALAAYRASLEIARQLAGPDVSRQRDLAESHEKIGTTELAMGDAPAALASYRASLAIEERLVRLEPENAGWRRDLGVTYNLIGDAEATRGDGAAALAAYRAALTIFDGLLERDATHTGWQRDVSTSRERIGDVELALGDLDAALRDYRASLEIRERLRRVDPTNTEWQRDLAIGYDRVGDVLREQGDLAGALALQEQSLAIRQTLAEQDRTNAQWQMDVSVGHEKVGNLERKLAHLDRALASYRASLAIRAAMVASDRDDADWLQGLSIAHEKVGDVLVQQGLADRAVTEYRASLEASEAIARIDPSNLDQQTSVAMGCAKLASALADLDRPQAQQLTARAISILTGLRDAGRLPPGREGWLAAFEEQARSLAKAPRRMRPR